MDFRMTDRFARIAHPEFPHACYHCTAKSYLSDA